MNASLHDRKSTVAILAMLFFVVQMVLSSWAMAGQPPLDAFGNPLCVTGAGGDMPSPAKDHEKQTACCTFGCGSFASALATAGGNISDLAFAPRRDMLSPLRRPIVLLAGHDHDPGNPRAPPLTI